MLQNKPLEPLEYVIEKEIHVCKETVVYSGYSYGIEHKKIVIKTLRNDYPTEEEEARFKQEYDFVKELSGDGTVQVYGFQKLLKKDSIIMDSFGTFTLMDYFKRHRKVDLKEFLKIALNLISELDKIHRHHIIHKDIHPSNILIDEETLEIKIIDFGIASILSSESSDFVDITSGEGSLSYISPERTGRINREIDYRTDYYSLGIVLYQLISGKLPFTSKEISQIIYDHIVTIPKMPHEIDPSIPVVVSKILMKLLAKTAEERYQSLYGLKEDLLRCQEQLQMKNKILDFTIGKKDVATNFTISEKIYGREEEVEKLIAIFDRACHDKIQFMLIAGDPGVGKSTLVHKLYKPLILKHGNFINGKFDQFQKNLPYTGFIQAFKYFTKQLLTKDKNEIDSWRERMKRAVGDNGQIITDLVPLLTSIIGKQKPLLVLSPVESQNRFNLVMQNFVQSLAISEHPLVIFLDDCQWADLPSLQLIESLLLKSDSRNLLLIAAFRVNEVNEDHILMNTIHNLKIQNILVEKIVVKPLEIKHVQQLLKDNLYQEEANVKLLTKVIYEKTQGNPFFLIHYLQMLYNENIIFFNEKEGKWYWDIEKVRNTIGSLNVIELMVKKINQLSRNTQHALMMAACLGNQFDLHNLSLINEKSSQETAADLWDALEVGLIRPKNDNYNIASKIENAKVSYQFLHDRIQQAAYSLTKDKTLNELQLKIGRLLLKATPANKLNDEAMNIVDHINLGLNLITDEDEKQKIIELNYLAGTKAKNATAYKVAMNYFKTAISLLNNDAWKINYSQTLSIYTEATETAYLSQESKDLNEFSDQIFKNALSNTDKISAYENKILYLASQNTPKAAMSLAREVLATLGVSIPQKVTKFQLFLAYVKLRLILAMTSKKRLHNLQKMTDPNLIAVMRIFSCIYMSSGSTNVKMFFLTMLNACYYSIKYGVTKYTSLYYLAYAIFLWKNDKLKSNLEFSKLALENCERFYSPDEHAKSLYIFNCGIAHWHYSLRNSIFDLKDSMQKLVTTGSLEHAGYSIFLHDISSIYCSKSLKSNLDEIKKHLHILVSLGEFNTEIYEKILEQFVMNIMGDVENPLKLAGPVFVEDEMMPKFIAENMYGYFVILTHYKMLLTYLLGDIKSAYELASTIRKYINQPVGTYLSARSRFFRALICLDYYPHADVKTKKEILKSVRKTQAKFELWSGSAPMNFSHNYKLIQAELARISNDNVKAIQYYNESIELATKNNFLSDKALANELAGKFYLAQDLLSIAKMHMYEAYVCYKLWGAIAKTKQLESAYRDLLIPTAADLTDFVTKGDKIYSPQVGINSIVDLEAVIKANLAITSEIELDSLLKKLMFVVMQSAEAQSGLLLLKEDEHWLVQAVEEQKNAQITEILTLRDKNLMKKMPVSVINYVSRTKQGIVIDNAITSELFGSDPYIQKNKTLSILALPLIKQDKLVGILYLENNLTKKAFTNEKSKLLTLLSAQFATSIENAKLFTEVKVLNETYIRFIPKEFLSLLKKTKIVDIKLGDQIQTEMTIMFCDIRGFTSLSEQMSPQDNINFINSFLTHLGPAITNNHGFIDKYIGDAIMALFPISADDALHSAIDLFQMLNQFNKERKQKNRKSIQIGVGLNFGGLMLGMVGYSSHMEGTVISDAVNVASGVEALTKIFHTPLLITETVYNKLSNPKLFSIRKLGTQLVKGKAHSINIYEVFSHEIPEQLILKNQTRSKFEEAVELFNENDIKKAYRIFKTICTTNPHDIPAQVYLDNCQKILPNNMLMQPEKNSASDENSSR